MKKLIITTTISACAITMVLAQGTVNFNTSLVGARVLMPTNDSWNSKVWAGEAVGSTAVGAPAGTLFLAQLYYAAGTVANSASLVPVGVPVNIRSGTSGGYNQITGTTTLGVPVTTTTVALPGVTPGAVATLQLRAWYAGTGGSQYPAYYDMSNGPQDGLFGFSNLISIPTGGGGDPPATPALLTGLQSFNLIPVPEPTTWALLGLGAAALLIFRRRN